ncbi:tRNA pseudouridine(13) synthase TruD [Vibrio gallicus]|uniref:tRNA pseudouridine(13) synthase TruD n=1 Tax=Vibrio gallicus TaxID=190897 RepID=UPI0021C2F96E|nr:tRNA pseudouridine(13) synthase TruD [Vibrio gallicus]
MTDTLGHLAYLHGKPLAKAKLKVKPEHFIVKEDLGYEFSGQGEHLMVRIRKSGENTSFVANELAKFMGVKSKDIGWAGLKDRHAITEQWLSVHLPKGDTPDMSLFTKRHPSVQILETTRHDKKLRPGDLKGNYFEITLTEVSDLCEVEMRLQQVAKQGVPNYFGEQRFGNNANNVIEARRWGRDNVRTRNQNKRSLYLSAARSWIFNQIVSNRIEQHCFEHAIEGDQVILDGSLQAYTDDFNAITAALAGDNALPTQGAALALEQQVVDSEPDLMALIRGNRMRHDRREIKLCPSDLSWRSDADQVQVSFWLSSGNFATSIFREVVEEIPFTREFAVEAKPE